MSSGRRGALCTVDMVYEQKEIDNGFILRSRRQYLRLTRRLLRAPALNAECAKFNFAVQCSRST